MLAELILKATPLLELMLVILQQGEAGFLARESGCMV